MKCSLAAAALAFTTVILANPFPPHKDRRDIKVDTLVSRRLQKRFLDERGNYNISLYHLNDVHAHLDEFRSTGTDCVDPTKGCFGGYARVKTVIDRERPTKEDSLFLNAGDEFQGTLFFTYYKGEKIAETINQLGFDAMTLGNHEFDLGDDILADFLSNLTFPVVSSNIQTNHTKLNETLVPYHIFEKHDLALVAVTTTTTPDIANPGPGTKFEDPITAIQRTVDYVKSENNITRIIALTHIGYEEDIELAKKTRGVHLIIGGHSHTLLGDQENAEGKYPTIEENLDGDEVFVVTAYRWGEYLGYIDVAYDPSGKIVAYTGAPIHLTNATTPEPQLQAQIKSWRGPFEEFAAEEMGDTTVELPASICRYQECLLGNVMTDAMLESRPNGDIAIHNAGGIRADIDSGKITRGEVLTTFPFGNSLVELEFTGKQLRDAFEGIFSLENVVNKKPVTSFVQVSKGTEIVYNPNGEKGRKLVSFKIKGEEVDPEKTYNVVTLDFLATGGDSFFVPVEPSKIVTLQTQDEAIIEYLEKNSPIDPKIEGRIKNGTSGDADGNGNGGNGDNDGADSGVGRIGLRDGFLVGLMTAVVVGLGMVI